MLDLNTPRGKIIDAALRLAAEEGWNGLALDRIAAKAGINLAEFRKEFAGKPQILAAFTRAVDDAVLAKVAPEAGVPAPRCSSDRGQLAPARERLFEVIMTRFELMAPYKAGLHRIHNDLRLRPGAGLAQVCVTARSQYWMLAAAGVAADGPRGALHLPGLVGIYARVFDVWLDDGDAGLAKTMAALDSRLRRGEHFMQRLDDIRAAAERFCCAFVPPRCPGKKTASPEAPKPAPADAKLKAEPAPIQQQPGTA